MNFDRLLGLLDQMEATQREKVLELARRLMPGLTAEDIRNPHDFPDLDDPDWHFEDGQLAGIQAVRFAIRRLAGELGGEPALEDDEDRELPLKHLSVGFIPIAQREVAATPVDELVAEIGRVLGVSTVGHRAADYRGLVGALEQGTVHVAWVPPLIAARSVIARRILPVGVAVRDGTTHYWAALITHAASKIVSPKDLSRSSAAWVDRESASGYSVVRMALRAAGISLVDAFGDETFARSHGEVARLVMSRQVEVGATYVNYLPDQTTIVRGGWTRVPGVEVDAVRVVAQAGPIPNDFFAVHGNLPRALLESFTTALIDGRHGSKINHYAKQVLRADGFVRHTHEHTTMLQDLVRMLEPPQRTA